MYLLFPLARSFSRGKLFFPVSGQNFFSPLSVDVFPVLNIRLFFRLVDKNNFYAIHVPVNVVGVFMFLRLNIFYIFFRWINFMCTHWQTIFFHHFYPQFYHRCFTQRGEKNSFLSHSNGSREDNSYELNSPCFERSLHFSHANARCSRQGDCDLQTI